MVRVKNRYITFKILYPVPLENDSPDTHYSLQILRSSSNSITTKIITDSIKQQVHSQFGDYGLGVVTSNFQLKYFSNKTSTAILKVGRGESCEMVVLSLITVQSLAQIPVTIEIQRVSGTIRKAQEFLISRDKKAIGDLLEVSG